MQTRQQQPRPKGQMTRDFQINTLRAMEGEGNERKFELSFSSEEPYSRYWGVEVLDHAEGAVDLNRLNEIGCVLFNHNRDAVIGKINKAWVKDNRGIAEIEFDSDEESEKIYQKVKSGTLKGVSVGYRVDSWEEVMPNKVSADGRFTGPSDIARKWTPFEVSIVSVPADPTVGVGRDAEDGGYEKPMECGYRTGSSIATYEWQIKINMNTI